jgi:hypothetical protein
MDPTPDADGTLTVGELSDLLAVGPDPGRPLVRSARVYVWCGPRMLAFAGDRLGADGSLILTVREARPDERAEAYRRIMPAGSIRERTSRGRAAANG